MMTLDVKPDLCLWVRDLDDVVSDRGRLYVSEIRKVCNCSECKKMREKNDSLPNLLMSKHKT